MEWSFPASGWGSPERVATPAGSTVCGDATQAKQEAQLRRCNAALTTLQMSHSDGGQDSPASPLGHSLREGAAYALGLFSGQ